MSRRTIRVDQPLYEYLLKVSLREHELLRRLREETDSLPNSNMQISPDQGQFMALLVRLMQVRRIVEVGVFTGYSSLAMALALPPDGRLVACDLSEKWTAVARRYWEAAGVADRIELRLGPAIKTLDALRAEGAAGTVDLIFLDADKTEYLDYYERGLELLRRGGLILVDNVLWSGAVADPGQNDADTRALREFNEILVGDERIDLSLLPLADGLTLARKR